MIDKYVLSNSLALAIAWILVEDITIWFQRNCIDERVAKFLSRGNVPSCSNLFDDVPEELSDSESLYLCKKIS